MRNPVLIALTGLPAAGKSTFASRLGRTLFESHDIRAIIIASDAVRAEIPALERTFLPDLEPLVRRMTLDRVASAVREGLWVIHDDLNYYRSMRFELVSIARTHEIPHALIHIATPVETCLGFNEARGRKIPDEVIRKDHARFDAPGLDPWDEPFAVWSAPGRGDENLKVIVQQLLEASENYRPAAPPEKEPHVPTRAEELDLLSRKVVGDLYRSFEGTVDGKTVSRLRQELVTQAFSEGLADADAMELFRREIGKKFN